MRRCKPSRTLYKNADYCGGYKMTDEQKKELRALDILFVAFLVAIGAAILMKKLLLS